MILDNNTSSPCQEKEMIVIRQKEFNSKAQKARRRKYDLQQGSTANYSDYMGFADEGKRLSQAQSQDKMLGRDRTNELLNKWEKSVKGSEKGWFGDRKIKYDGTDFGNKKKLEEVERAKDLLRAGRERNRDRQFPTLYEKREKDVNTLINSGEAGGGDKFNRHKIKDALKESRKANPRKKATNLKMVKNLKTAGKVGLGVAATAGLGYGIKKAVDKNKKEDGKEK